MRLTIEDLQDSIVRFTTNFGTAVAKWNGPLIGRGSTVDVELDIDRVLDDSVVQILDDPEPPQISGDETNVTITATVEHIWDDWVIFLRLADSCTIMVESVAGACAVGQCVRIRIPPEMFSVTPYGY